MIDELLTLASTASIDMSREELLDIALRLLDALTVEEKVA